jgi:hypothetical protein
MSDFRRTLPLPPPGRFIGDSLDDGQRTRGGRKTPGERQKSLAPPKVPQLGNSSARDLRKSKPGRKTPILERAEADAGSPVLGALERGVPSHIAKARALLAALEEPARAGTASPKLQACIERAYAAWNLEGVPPRQIARVAHLAHRAYDAIRGTSRGGIEAAYADCARILHLGLPSAFKRRVALETVVDIVRAMRREADGWAAVVEATMALLGWADAGRGRAAEAIRQALEEFPPESAGSER